MPSAFLSHSSIDKPFVRALKTNLEAAGVSVWLDEDQIQPGQSLVDRINHGLASNDFVLLVISANFLASDWALWETNASITSAIKTKPHSVIPLLVENVWDSVPPLLRDKVYVDFRNSGNILEYRHSLGRLVSTLTGRKTAPLVKSKTPVVLVTGGRDPSQNALAFTAAYEFGRLFGKQKRRCVTGVSKGVDERFARGLTEQLIQQGLNPHEFLTCYGNRGGHPDHAYGQQIESAYSHRSEGIPEIIAETDVVVLFGGSKNTQYIGVLALLEGRVVIPVAATCGAAKDLYTIILSRYRRVFGDQIDIRYFHAVANLNATPLQIAEHCIRLIDLCQ